MVEESSAPVRRLLFTRAPAVPQPSSKTPFDTIPERHGKDVNSTSILEALRLSGALGSSLSGSSEKGTMTPTKTTALPKTESIPPAPKSPGPFSFIKKSDSLQSSPSAASAEVAQVQEASPSTKDTQSHLLKVRQLIAPEMVANEPDQDQTEVFLAAAERGESTKVRKMLQYEGHAPDCCNYEGRTALILAAMHGHRDVALALLGSGADPNAQDKEGATALVKAVKNGHDSIVSLLRSCGAELEMSSAEAATQLCTCVFDCNVPLLRRYMKAGILVNAGNFDSRTALHVATAEGNLAAVRVLVEEGKADLGVQDRWGATPLDEAMRAGSRAVMDYLQGINAPTKRDDDRTMEFLYAASRGDTAKLRHMIQYGFDVNKADYDNRTALMLAVVGGHSAAVNTLLGAGADANVQDNLGSNALVEACRRGHEGLIRLLVDNGAKLGFDEIRSASELCTAAAQGKVDLIRHYIKGGINVDAADYDKRTALHIAAADGCLEVVRVLVEEGQANFDVRDGYCMDPLDEAMRHRHGDIADLLLKNGALVKALIQEGNADFEVRDRWSLDALDEAMRERREDVVKFLQQSGALIGGS